MNYLGYLFAANVFVWGAIISYLFRLMKKNNTLQRDLDLLKEALRKDSEY